MSYHLIEPSVDLILTLLKSRLPAELANVRAVANQTTNLGLATPPPKQFFWSKNLKALDPPTVYVIPQSIDFKKDRGTNHVNATASFEVAVVCEAQTTQDVSRMCWRYQAALHKILDQARLTSADSALTLTCIPKGGEFGEEFDPSDKPGKASGVFRKGVLIRMDVEIYEA